MDERIGFGIYQSCVISPSFTVLNDHLSSATSFCFQDWDDKIRIGGGKKLTWTKTLYVYLLTSRILYKKYCLLWGGGSK